MKKVNRHTYISCPKCLTEVFTFKGEVDVDNLKLEDMVPYQPWFKRYFREPYYKEDIKCVCGYVLFKLNKD